MNRKSHVTSTEYLLDAYRADNERLREILRREDNALLLRIAQANRYRLRVRQLEAQLRRHGIEPESEAD